MANQNSNSAATTGGISFMSLLGILFIGLKLAGIINWSWWYVLLPLYGGVVVIIVAVLILFFVAIYKLYKNQK